MKNGNLSKKKKKKKPNSIHSNATGICIISADPWQDIKTHQYSLLECHHQSLYHNLIFHLLLYVHISSTNHWSSSRLCFYRTVPLGEPACIQCQVTTHYDTKGIDQIKTLTKLKHLAVSIPNMMTGNHHLFSIIPWKSILTNSLNWVHKLV